MGEGTLMAKTLGETISPYLRESQLIVFIEKRCHLDLRGRGQSPQLTIHSLVLVLEEDSLGASTCLLG